MEKYEYSTLIAMADMQSMIQCAQLLEETMDEEAETDEKLTDIAERINRIAAVMKVEKVA